MEATSLILIALSSWDTCTISSYIWQYGSTMEYFPDHRVLLSSIGFRSVTLCKRAAFEFFVLIDTIVWCTCSSRSAKSQGRTGCCSQINVFWRAPHLWEVKGWRGTSLQKNVSRSKTTAVQESLSLGNWTAHVWGSPWETWKLGAKLCHTRGIHQTQHRVAVVA